MSLVILFNAVLICRERSHVFMGRFPNIHIRIVFHVSQRVSATSFKELIELSLLKFVILYFNTDCSKATCMSTSDRFRQRHPKLCVKRIDYVISQRLSVLS